MKNLIFSLCVAASFQAAAFEVVSPDVETAEISIHSPDEDVATLGQVDIFIDLAAEFDSLFELKIRRAELKLEDGTISTAFGYNQSGGVIVVAGEPVTRVTVTGVDNGAISVIFYDKNYQIVAPPKKSIRVFGLDLQPRNFDYNPAQPPSKNFKLDVAVLLDRSGSMQGQMGMVQSATQTFLRELPSFTMCNVLTFGSTVETLTQSQMPCASATNLLHTPIIAEGGTALASALERGMNARATPAQSLSNLVIVVTDGVSTEAMDKKKLTALKAATKSKILVFWAGFHAPEHLKGLADFETASSSNIKNDLDAFFRSIGVSVSGMQTLTLI